MIINTNFNFYSDTRGGDADATIKLAEDIFAGWKEALKKLEDVERENKRLRSRISNTSTIRQASNK